MALHFRIHRANRSNRFRNGCKSRKWFYFVNVYHEVGAKNTTAGNKPVLRVEKVF